VPIGGGMIRFAAVACAAAALCGCGGGAGVAGGAPEAGPSGSDAAVERPAPPLPYPRPDYQRLSETGLFVDGDPATIAADAMVFEPTYKLWSDGASKRRWIALPPGTQIDTSDMDHWIFPVGTKFWKEFSLDGVVLETRLIERYGTEPDDYWMGAFVWNTDQSDAVFTADGQQNINDTIHDAPAQKDCGKCHRGDIGRILGFSAIQLTSPLTGPTLRTLNAMDLLTTPAADDGYPAPGDAQAAQALGYMHANCGHCHNKNGAAWPDTRMVLRLRVADRDLLTSEVYQSIVDTKLEYWRGGAIKLRVAPAQPDASAIAARMETRGSDNQMPPLATEIVDTAGIELVRAWITSLGP
jgi:mono/diheme cytochrome c family protein